MAHIELPYVPPSEYDFRVVFRRIVGNGEVVFVLCGGGRQFAWHLGADRNHVCAFGIVDGKAARDNSTTKRTDQWIANGRRYTAVIKVRKDHVEAYLDDVLINDFRTDFSNVKLNNLFRQRRADTLGFLAVKSQVVLELAAVAEIGGHGRFLR